MLEAITFQCVYSSRLLGTLDIELVTGILSNLSSHYYIIKMYMYYYLLYTYTAHVVTNEEGLSPVGLLQPKVQ